MTILIAEAPRITKGNSAVPSRAGDKSHIARFIIYSLFA